MLYDNTVSEKGVGIVIILLYCVDVTHSYKTSILIEIDNDDDDATSLYMPSSVINTDNVTPSYTNPTTKINDATPSYMTSAVLEIEGVNIKVEDSTSNVSSGYQLIEKRASAGKLMAGLNCKVALETVEENETIIKYKPACE